MNYIIDQIYDFPVAPPDTAQDDFFNLKVETPSGPSLFKLNKLPFQRHDNYSTPHSISCRVKSFTEDGIPVLTHVIGPYVYELYKSTFENNESFECEVMTVPAVPAEEDRKSVV